MKNTEQIKPLKVSKTIEFLILISIFVSSYVFFTQPFEFYLHYIIYITLIPLFALHYGYPKYAGQIMLITLILGSIDVFLGNCDGFMFVKTWGGLLLSLTFYSYVVQYYGFNLEYLFQKYLKGSYWMALIAVFQFISFLVKFTPGYNYKWILNKWGFAPGGLLGIRLNGIFSEPSTLAVVLAPAVYIAAYNIVNKNNYVLSKLQSLLIVGVYIGSSSSTAYIGLFIIMLLVTDSLRVRYVAVGVVVVGFFGSMLYNNVGEFRSRIDTSVRLWMYADFSIENTNTSGFVLYNNAQVTADAFVAHPFFGTGLGSYNKSYEKYSLTKSVLEYDFEFNTTDGNSMLLRMIVETGLFGTGFFMLLLFRGYVGRNASDENRHFRLISQSILIMILLYLLRQGNYYLNALPMFVMIYYFNWKQFKDKLLLESSLETESEEKEETEALEITTT